MSTQTTMFDGQTETLRHPMWTAPPESALEGAMPTWMFDVATRVARELVRFDGRPNSEMVVAYCKEVYEKVLGNAISQAECVGLLVSHRRHWVTRLNQMVTDGQPVNAPRYRKDAANVDLLGHKLVDAALTTLEVNW